MAGRLVAGITLLLALGLATRLSGQPRTADDLIRYYQARVVRQADFARNHAGLGQAYILKARETGDPQYYELADQALTRSLALAPDPATAARATTDLAVVQMARHRFRDALATARRALAFGSGVLNPYGLLGDTHLELGEYTDAEAAYEQMRGAPGGAARLSMLRFLKGDPAGALAEMRRAVRGAIEGRQPAEHVAWAQSRLGTLLFQTGDLVAAGPAHQDALATFPGYHRALAGLAQVRAAEGRHPEAIELYRRAIAVIPLPEYAASLGDIYAKLGRAEEAEKQYALVEYIGRVTALNQVLYNRELALFYADHDRKLGEALDLARRELTVRGDIYTHDVLAWALFKNGRTEEATAAMREALRLGTRDARLLFHAGMIARAAGERERARDFLRQALAVNPRFHVLQAEVAERTLAELPVEAGRP
jgi:tetratricopeptide (TPR) repeat protein